ncbi:hypothetical protein RD110_07565 [Rhodoferax koreense]|uniref:Uncharacterized protein n=1 Tax=Rhodoferax koreensis TaxID=1842727 RepID=A0A1P8JTK0_9BURK|nr:hypothetical protein [Rhodoferax koreense]APW37070.1 hypothetical protein RD110_07565 [Rhodoferax koreense]
MMKGRLTAAMALALMLATASLAAPLAEPARDDEVVEVLPAVTRSRPAPVASAAAARPADPVLAAGAAREAINVARQTGDARYWGRALSALAPWWDKPDAPPDLAILQATVQQGRHLFGPARAVLQATLARAPQHAQGWLDLAALERVEGRYAQALAACEAVGRAGQALYARACELETLSLQGRQPMAGAAFRLMLDSLPMRGGEAQRSWIYSLLAESEERAGRPAAARIAYTQSLAAEHDLYTAIAFSDLLLRTGDNTAARKLLAGLPLTDAVLLRQALALRRLNDAGWAALRDELHAREAALDRRGDDLDLHDRERALLAWWLDDAPARALPLALRNLALQREPIDWWIALEVAAAAGDTEAAARIRQQIQATGLQDQRLVAR